MMIPGVIASQSGSFAPLPAADRIAFSTVYTGNGTTQTITGVPFAPEMVWLKRTDDVENWAVFDTNRGVNLRLNQNGTVAEASSPGVSAFNSDGFDLGSTFNASGGEYTSTSFRTQNGAFSRVLYTGNGKARTMEHGLGTTPKLILVKARSAGVGWYVFYDGLSLPATQFLRLDRNAATGTSVSVWNSTLPTDTVFSLGATSNTNGAFVTYIAYCFASKSGVCFVGSYTGNGGARTPKVTTGFRPRVVLIKRHDATADGWGFFDDAMDPTNPHEAFLLVNSDAGLSTAADMDTEVDGFTLGGFNVSGAPYLVLAF